LCGETGLKLNPVTYDIFEPAGRFVPAAPKEKNMKRTISLRVGLLAFALLPALGQTTQPNLGKIHGHVTNPTGTSESSGSVVLSTDGGHTAKYTFPVDANGDYTGEAGSGTYTVLFRRPDTPPDKMIDVFENVKVTAGGDVLQDFDMSRKAFIDKLPPEQQKQLEELKKHNAEALKTNEVIKTLNADIKVAAQDIKDGDAAAATAKQTLGAAAAKADIEAKEAEIKTAKYTEVETMMLKDTAAKPDASVLWAYLGEAQSGLKKYDEAIASFKKAIDVDLASKKPPPNPQIQGLAQSGLGEIYARTGKIQEANDAYDAAAKVYPTLAGFYLKNEAVIFFQTQQADAQVAAADKAIAVTPDVALLYYLKGNGLVGKTTMDDKTKKLVPPPGCMEAYQKYLQLDPNGLYSADVKSILASFNQSIDTSYKAGKKK
jgi:tetratricopeptide (TPR) repeat protein